MAVQVTLRVPESVYERARQLAHSRQQDVAAAIASFLEESLPPAPFTPDVDVVSIPDEAIVREIAAYQEMHSELWQKYPGHHVAVYEGRLVDHDVDGVALSLRINEKYPDDFVLIRQVESQPERVLHFRSPGLVDG